MRWRSSCIIPLAIAMLAVNGLSDTFNRTWADDAQPPNVLATLRAMPGNWSGFYAGVHAGAALGLPKVSDPYGTSLFGDKLRAPGFLLGGQAGYNWQPAGSLWVFGVEGDLSWLQAGGTSTCFAFDGEVNSSNCRTRPDFLGALTGRIGYAAGPGGRTLIYGKGGGAVLHNRIDATTGYGFGVFPITSTGASPTVWGFTIGAGIEQALSPAWSVKLEYNYYKFADATLTTPETFTATPGGIATAVAAANASVSQSMHAVKLGLNYHFGADPNAQWPASGAAAMAAAPPDFSGWQIEAGGRYWYSSGRFQKDLPGNDLAAGTSLISRLVYDDMSAHSGEIFGRIDTPWRVFLKGFVGLGYMTSGGRMNDEDWGLGGPPFTGYSNTLSQLDSSRMNYQTIDLGYDFLQGPGYKIGAFVGYSRVHEQYAASTCAQIASPSSGICSPPLGNMSVITETDTWQALRLGVTADLWLTPRWRFTGDAAWLPHVKFTGVDNHWLRDLVIDEGGRGNGVQLEAFVSYYVTPQLSVGVGARYWAMWTTSGSDAFNGEPVDRRDTYRYERFGGLLQASYTFH